MKWGLWVGVIIALVGIYNLVYAAQVEHIGFNDFKIYATPVTMNAITVSPSNGTVKIWEGVILLSSSTYVGGFYLHIIWNDNDGTTGGSRYFHIKYSTNNVDWYQTTTEQSPLANADIWVPFIATPNVYGDILYIQVWFSTEGLDTTDTKSVIVKDVIVYTLGVENGGILSKVTNIKYYPPGAEGTTQGFQLNKTEIYLKQQYNLSEGAISFWLKWDGTPNIQISDNIGIDSNGYIYIKSDNGMIYTLEGVSPPLGEYIPIYISWKPNNGYIMLNTTKISLNWGGNLVINKIGNVNNSTTTLIDEFKIWNSYIDPEVFLLGGTSAPMVVVFPNGQSNITIQSDDGSPLQSIQVSLYNTNRTFLANDTYTSFGDSLSFLVNVTDGVYAVFTTPTGSTTVFIRPNETMTVAIPGQSNYVQAMISPTTYPTGEQRQWVWLIVKDSQNRYIYRNKWDFTATPVILKVGASYVINVATEDFSKIQGVYFGLATSDIKINLPKVSDLTLYDNLTLFYNYDPQNNVLRIYYYDPSGATTNVFVNFYNFTGGKLLHVDFGNVNLVNFKANTIPFKFEFVFTRNNQTFNWTQILPVVQESAPAQEVGSQALYGLVLIIGMLFAFGAMSATWAPIATLIFGYALALAGLITFPASVASFMGAMAFMSFIENANMNATSLKQFATSLVFLSVAISVAIGVLNYYGWMGWGVGGYSGDNYIDIAGQQVVFWQNYTPQYTSYGVPIPTDSKQGILPFFKAVFTGLPQLLMSLGAPPVFAIMLQGLIWASFAAVLYNIFFGREV